MIGAGGAARTVGSIIDRLLVQIISPPDNQMTQVRLASSIPEDANVFAIGQFTVPEDQILMRPGSLLEAGQELMRIVSYEQTTQRVTVERGVYGTKVVRHNIPMMLTMNPAYTRAATFEAVADNIIQLYPRLFTVRQEFLSPISDGVYPVSDDLAVEVLSITRDFTGTFPLNGKIVDFHPMVGGRALIVEHGGGTVWMRYRRRMGKASEETDLLEDLGVDERWVQIVMAGAAADMLVGRDVAQARTDWVQSVLEAENISVGTRMSIAGGLRQYRNMLLVDAEREMKAEYGPKMVMNPAVEWGM